MFQEVKLQRSQAMQIFYFRSSSLPVSQRHCTKIPSSRADKSPVVAHLQNLLFCAYRMSVQHNLTRSLLSSLSLIMLLHTCAWVYYITLSFFKVSVQVCTSFLSIIHAGNEPVTETCLRISCLKNATSSRPLTVSPHAVLICKEACSFTTSGQVIVTLKATSGS